MQRIILAVSILILTTVLKTNNILILSKLFSEFACCKKKIVNYEKLDSYKIIIKYLITLSYNSYIIII